MFRNQYDNDVSVWSPQGRIHQIEYAMEAVKQGSATIGLKNSTHAILLALKRAPSELSAFQKKIFPVDDHVGVAIAGLLADGRALVKFLRNQCLISKWSFESGVPIQRLVGRLANKMQQPTMVYGGRPYGVGILMVGHDESGPHVFYQCPSANYYDCRAYAVGSRAQSARTYLERHLDEFANCSLDELIHHGLQALSDTLPNDAKLTAKNCTLAIIGKGMQFTIHDDDAIEPYLATIKKEPSENVAEESDPADVEMQEQELPLD